MAARRHYETDTSQQPGRDFQCVIAYTAGSEAIQYMKAVKGVVSVHLGPTVDMGSLIQRYVPDLERRWLLIVEKNRAYWLDDLNQKRLMITA